MLRIATMSPPTSTFRGGSSSIGGAFETMFSQPATSTGAGSIISADEACLTCTRTPSASTLMPWSSLTATLG